MPYICSHTLGLFKPYTIYIHTHSLQMPYILHINQARSCHISIHIHQSAGLVTPYTHTPVSKPTHAIYPYTYTHTHTYLDRRGWVFHVVRGVARCRRTTAVVAFNTTIKQDIGISTKHVIAACLLHLETNNKIYIHLTLFQVQFAVQSNVACPK